MKQSECAPVSYTALKRMTCESQSFPRLQRGSRYIYRPESVTKHCDVVNKRPDLCVNDLNTQSLEQRVDAYRLSPPPPCWPPDQGHLRGERTKRVKTFINMYKTWLDTSGALL